MPAKTLKEIATKMANLDIAMLTTHTSRGQLSSRPMSNNGDVEYDGNSYYFTYEGSRTVRDITENAHVSLGFSGPKGLYISIVGSAHLIRQKATMQKHWVPDLEVWFKDGIDTPGLVLVRVQANRIKYWQNEEQGEVHLKQ
ncbi:pyridoxamine 5'-phosphate oxidase family protein [Hymenobacter sp. BT683]|uniref:Pyridoxamine 5'-phosphate oxidase family protein n=1 Tax=Hymenobacter jeongseonensis TaxID=2791027 RepID=A0ABS0IGL9_9BACT|nr:pyridoxamine 5'-phosphate oxidase family protein [Hymenobacter jeongseonensis]MBF9237508.1 pyridoxamine 5'-phosphate oxidase family protein [Hymenobacter jeongseonensis]